jgi:tetratricopeptide (TPR) repeat protein
MRISRDELILIGLDLLLSESEKGISYNKEDLSVALDITEKTLNDYLTKLKKAGLVERNQKKFIKDLDSTVSITENGKERLEVLWESVNRLVLTPEHHNIPSIVKVKLILDRLRDPLEKVFFLSIYSANKDFDLFMFLDALKISKADSNIINIFSEMDLEEEEISRIPFIVTFSKTSFHGGFDQELLQKDGWGERDPNAILVIAEADQKQGRLNDAKAYYDYLLSQHFKLTQNQWFLARMGLVHTYRKMGETQTALKFLDETMEITDNKTYLAYGKQLKALMFSLLGKFEDSLKLYNSAIRSFHSYGLPLMLSITYNNRGTLYYRMEDYDNAIDDWKKARRYATEAKSEYCEAAILSNLADMSGRNDEFDLAMKYLKRGEKISKNTGDLEMLSMIYFNFSLVYIMMNDLEKAVNMYKISDEVGFPLPSPLEKQERRNYIIQYSKERGLSEIENMI